MNTISTKAYSVPFRTLWLQGNDSIELRVTLSRRPHGEQTVTFPVTAHLDPDSKRLLGLMVADHKSMRLGRWIRQNWSETAHDPDEPVPSSTVVYDEAAQIAYFSIWPNLNGVEPALAERRRAEIIVDSTGDLLRIRLPVTVRRSDDGLAVAAGYLSTR